MEELEDEPDLVAAHARELGLGRDRAVSSPSNWYEPEVGRSRQPRMLSRVDFPEPDGPMIETYSPAAMSRSKSRSACTGRPPTSKVRQIAAQRDHRAGRGIGNAAEARAGRRLHHLPDSLVTRILAPALTSGRSSETTTRSPAIEAGRSLR